MLYYGRRTESNYIPYRGGDTMTKANRVLALFYRLLMGQRVKKGEYAAEAGITERSAERDIQTLRDVLADEGHGYALLLSKDDNCYFLDNAKRQGFTKKVHGMNFQL